MDPISQLRIAKMIPNRAQRSLVFGEPQIIRIENIGTKLKMTSSLHQVGSDNPLRIPRWIMRITRAELRRIG